MFKLKLHWQILIAMAIGIFVGYLFYKPVNSIENTFEYTLLNKDDVYLDEYDNGEEFMNSFRMEIQSLDIWTPIFPSDGVGLSNYDIAIRTINYIDSLKIELQSQVLKAHQENVEEHYYEVELSDGFLDLETILLELQHSDAYQYLPKYLDEAREMQEYEREIHSRKGEYYVDVNDNGKWDASGIKSVIISEEYPNDVYKPVAIYKEFQKAKQNLQILDSLTFNFLDDEGIVNKYFNINEYSDSWEYFEFLRIYYNDMKMFEGMSEEDLSSNYIDINMIDQIKWDSADSEPYYDFNSNGVYDAPIGDNKVFSFIESLGTIFVRLLKMIIIPLIFTSIITGVSGIADRKKLGRLGAKTIGYYILTSMCAIIIGLTLTNLIQPGKGMPMGSQLYDHSNLQTERSVGDILIDMIPTNPISAMAEGDMLSIIFFAIFLGVVITQLPDNYRTKLRSFFIALFEGIMIMTKFIIMLAPIGVFGLITKTVATSGFEMFSRLGFYMLTIFAGLSIHILIVLPLIFFLFTRINPIYHFKAMASAMATAFSTSSSSATLPVTMKCVKENANVSDETSSFVLPMGATVNMDGTALYECAGVIFIAQVLGVDLSFAEQFTVVIVALLASIGAAGVPSAGLVMIFIVTQAVGFDNDQVAIIIGSMLAVDRPLDMLRTMVNIFSDSVGAAVIAKSEGESLYQNN